MELAVKLSRRKSKFQYWPSVQWQAAHHPFVDGYYEFELPNRFGRPVRKSSRRGKPQEFNRHKAKADGKKK